MIKVEVGKTYRISRTTNGDYWIFTVNELLPYMINGWVSESNKTNIGYPGKGSFKPPGSLGKEYIKWMLLYDIQEILECTCDKTNIRNLI